MQFSEDDLREALKRKDPGPGFTQRVMARVNQEETTNAATSPRSAPGWWMRMWSWRPVLAGAMAVLLLVVGWMGYTRYQHEQELRQAKLAEQQVKLALRITNAKMSQVLQRVSAAQPRESNIRRQTL